MLQIKNMLGGGKPEGLYAWKKNSIGSELKEINKSVSTLPYSFLNGSAVVLNGEIHILGSSSDSTSHKSHYKWDGTSWTSVSTLPYNFYQGSAVVLNGEIHILGSHATGVGLNHYKWDGTSWTSVSTLPYNFYQGSAVVLNNEIHILGSSYGGSVYKNHYKFDGSSWVSVSTLPYNFYLGSAVVLNNEIHILGTYGNSKDYKSHYKWDGSSWTSVSTLPYNFFSGSAVVFNNEIHILGGDGINYHYEWNGLSWTSASTLPYKFSSGGAVVYNDAIHTLGSSNDSTYYEYHYLVYGYVPVYTFLDYVVSDKETAYPDGGEKGGYYYEKVGEGITPEMFGCTKMAIDYKIWASASGSIRYDHSLGEAPKVAILTCGGNAPLTGSGVLTDICLGSYCVHNRLVDGKISVGSNSTNASLEKTSVSHSQINGTTFAGVKYTIITMA